MNTKFYNQERIFFIFLICMLALSYVIFLDFLDFNYVKSITWHFILLLLVSIGIATGAKSNNLNLGNEGQIYVGALVSYLLCEYFSLNYYNFVFILILTACLVGVLGIVPFLLKYFFHLNGMLATLLMSYGNQKMVDGCILSLITNDSYLMQTKDINIIFDLNSSLMYLLVVVLLIWSFFIFIFSKTIIGLKLRILQDKLILSKYFNINIFKYSIFTVFSNAFLNGLVGALVLIFFQHHLFLGITSKIGWNGFIVAILSSFNYIYMFFFSLFFSFLNEFNDYIQINFDFKYDLTSFYQAISIFISLFLIKKES